MNHRTARCRDWAVNALKAAQISLQGWMQIAQNKDAWRQHVTYNAIWTTPAFPTAQTNTTESNEGGPPADPKPNTPSSQSAPPKPIGNTDE